MAEHIAAERAELLRLTAAAVAAVRPLARRLSGKSRDAVGPVLMVCSALAASEAEAVREAFLVVEAFARIDRRRAAPVLRMVPLRGEADSGPAA